MVFVRTTCEQAETSKRNHNYDYLFMKPSLHCQYVWLFGIERYDDRWIMNWKVCGRKPPGGLRKTSMEFSQNGWARNWDQGPAEC